MGRGAYFRGTRLFYLSHWGGECSRGVRAGVATLAGCHSLPSGSAAAAAMLWVWCNHNTVENVVRMLSLSHPVSQRDGEPP